MLFISPMLATRPEDARRIASPHFIAELELDGQRAQLHVRAAPGRLADSCGKDGSGLPTVRTPTLGRA